jgi:hypothetical protein
MAADKTSLDTYDYELDTVQQFFRSKNSQGKITLASHLKSKINSKNNFGAGFYVNYNILNFTDSVYLKNFDRFQTLHNTDGTYLMYRTYAQYQHKFSDNLAFFAGVNAFANSINSDFAVEPRLGLEWKIGNLQTISVGLGEHSQMQPASVYFLQYNDTVNHKFVETNKEMGLTKAEHAVLGYSLKVFENVRFKVETYYQNLRNVPVSPSFDEFSMLNAGDNFYIPTTDSLQNFGKGKNYGVEFTFEKFLDKGYYILLTTSIFNSQYTGSDGKWRNTAFNSNYIFNLLTGYEFKLGKKTFITFDAKAVYSGGKRYIPIDLDASIANNEMTNDYSKSYDNKFEDYFRCDFRIGFKMNGKKINQEWALDLQNLTANQSTFTQGYNTRTKEIYSSYQQGFYPMFLYRIQF